MQKYLKMREEGRGGNTQRRINIIQMLGGGSEDKKSKNKFPVSIKIVKPLNHSVKQAGWYCYPNISYKNLEAQEF